MKVLLISHAYAVDITWNKVEMLGRHKDIDLFVLAPETWKHTLRTFSIRKKKPKNFKLISRKPVFEGRNYFYFFHGLRDIIREVNPDIIHIEEEPSSVIAYKTVKVGKKLGSKLVFFTWENIYKNYPFPFSKFERFVMKNSDYAICGNLKAKGVIRKKGFSKGVSLLPQFGIDVKVFKNKKSRVRKKLGLEKEFVIGFLGRLVKQKGLITLMKAADNLDCKVLVVGSGPLREKLLKDYPDKIILVDTVRHGNVVDYINAMDCLVLPSESTKKWKEQFGHVIIEAMACGVPVIGSTCGAIPEVVGDAGLVFKEGDHKDLAKKISMITGNKRLRQSMIKKGRKRVLKNFSFEKIDKDTYDIYRGLVK